MICRVLPVLVVVGGVCGIGRAQEQQVHWAVALGLRVEQVNRAFPVVDRVVLVPDGATYLAEVAKWSPRGRWPVLIEDDLYAPMFIRRFAPAQVMRRQSVGALPSDRQERQRMILDAVIRAWGGEPGPQTLRDVFADHGYVPPGVVIASASDPAWTAALALAAGRGQPIAWVDEPLGRPDETLDASGLGRLLAAVEEGVRATGYPYEGLGDALETITVCRFLPGKADMSRNPSARDLRAITDLLGRAPDGSRYAFAGWIFGNTTRSAYAAMCSLFLGRDNYWLYNTYPSSEGWAAYGMDEAASQLQAAGRDVTGFAGTAAGIRSWLDMLPGGVATDVLVMNSKGNADFLDLSDDRAFAGDVPVLNEPLALHLIHSWSLRSPESRATVGGRWLTHGVYACVGSVQEPNLTAFLPPKALAERWMSGIPFLVGARHWEAEPWKINTIGDPLMLCGPTDATSRLPAPDDGGIDVRIQVKALMRRADEDGTAASVSEALAALSLLGEDDVACDLWRLARGRGVTGVSAEALGPLFRTGSTDDFCRAWQDLERHDDRAVTMFWHLVTPRLGTLTDDNVLLMLQGAVRPHQAHADLERLAPHLTAAFGAPHTRYVIEQELAKTTGAQDKRRLERLLRSVR